MLSEQVILPDSQEQPITLPGLPYAVFPPVEERTPAPGQLNARQEAEHLTATFGYLATLEMHREG